MNWLGACPSNQRWKFSTHTIDTGLTISMRSGGCGPSKTLIFRLLGQAPRSRGMHVLIENKLKEMKRIRPSRIERYAGIRNKLAVHYDNQIVNMLKELGAIQSDAFFEDIEMMVRYSQEWLKALKSIGKLEILENTV